ncbi:MAG TPA: hypothetical protein VM120_15060 [Bryobacteraceae bacterium]|nr:hypothetical protein [Bryobacteraceae bacterium]
MARVLANGEMELAQFPYSGGVTDSFRSLLYLEKLQNGVKSWAGPEAIGQYLTAETKGRLIQSMKSFLASRSLQSTEVFGRRYTLEALIARILRNIRQQAKAQFATRIQSAVVGRPVYFVGAESDADNAYALSRLESALRQITMNPRSTATS